MPLRYKSRWTERDTAEFTRHHVSGKDTAVLMPSVRRLSILPSPAHAQMIIGDELRSEVKRDGGLAIPISLILDRWMDRDRMGDSCSCPACWWLDGEGEGGGEPALLACSPFPIQKWRTDGRTAAAEKKRRIDNDSDVLRAFRLSPPPTPRPCPSPYSLPAHAARH